MLKERSKQKKVNQESYAILFSYLITHGAGTAEELVEATGLNKVTVYDLLRVLRRHKVIHISAWMPDALDRDAIAVFSFGRKPDAKRRKLTAAQRQQRWRDRQRKLNLQAALTAAPSVIAA